MIIEGVGCGGRAQRMRSDFKAKRLRVFPHHAIDAIRRYRLGLGLVAPVTQRTEEGACVLLAVATGLQVIGNKLLAAGCSGT